MWGTGHVSCRDKGQCVSYRPSWGVHFSLNENELFKMDVLLNESCVASEDLDVLLRYTTMWTDGSTMHLSAQSAVRLL